MPAHKGSGNAFHGAGQSQVGHGAFYEADDQRKEPRAVTNERDRYRDGKVGNQQNLSTKDEYVLANKVAEQQRHHDRPHKHHGKDYDALEEIGKSDPTRPASLQGHEPSRGAKLDKEIKQDDEQRLREKEGK